jgi:hypothetical protein
MALVISHVQYHNKTRQHKHLVLLFQQIEETPTLCVKYVSFCNLVTLSDDSLNNNNTYINFSFHMKYATWNDYQNLNTQSAILQPISGTHT